MVAATTVFQQFDLALKHHRAGRAREATQLYERVVEAEPLHDQALYLLGVLALEAGTEERAATFFERAVRAAPHKPAYHSNLGEAYRRLGRYEEAAPVLVHAATLRPDLPEAHFNLGLVLVALGDKASARQSFERAADLKPDSFPMQYRLAATLASLGEGERALGHYHCALALKPAAVDLLMELGLHLRKLERFDGAIAMQRRILALKPDSALCHAEIADALLEQNRLDEAMAACRAALELDPRLYPAESTLGHALEHAGLVHAGLEHFRRAMELAPAVPLINSWLVYLSAFDPHLSAAAICETARSWATRHAAPKGQRLPPTNSRDPERRLRLGYVSPNFCTHCQAFFLVPLLRQHDPGAFEVFCYSDVPKPDDTTKELKSHSDAWRDISGMTDANVAGLVRADCIDILVDLTMHMEKSRLLAFAEKPAPVQIAWLAYPGTTGLSAMDYRISDPFLDPPGFDPTAYVEATLVLRDTFWCYDPLTSEPHIGPLPALANGYVTFGCLNNFNKVGAGVLELWGEALKAVESSRLILLAPRGEARRRSLDVFGRYGVGPERIEFVDRHPRPEYLRLYQRIDIGLDPFPYNGHTTSLDAFWMGVPVVTLVGQTVVGRAGLAQAKNLELPELIATTPSEYVAIARALAHDLARLGDLRAGLRSRMERSPLMDARRFTESLEAAYRTAWRTWCERPRDD